MGAVALLFTTYIAAARYRSIEASAMLEQTRARTFAEAGINRAILDLLAEEATGNRAAQRRKAGGSSRVCGIGAAASVAISVSNENGRIDLNTADPELLRTVLFRFFKDAERTERVAAAILAGRQARAEEVPASGTQAGTQPPPRPQGFRSVVEAGGVPGLGGETFAALAPFLTVHSRSAGVNPALAPTPLRDVLTDGGAEAPHGSADASLFFVADAPGSIYRIAAEVVTVTGTRFAREAVVELDRGPPLGFKVREWRDGTGRLMPPDPRKAAALPPC